MRRGTIAALAGAALLAITAVGIALAKERPTIVEAGSLRLAIDGGVTPAALPKHELAPVTIHGSGELSTVDGSHPPALEEAVLDTDKDVVVSVKGLPVCRIAQLRARETKRAEAVCGDAIIGRGSATVEVAFPEQLPFDATGPLILFNGGERGGVVTMLAYTYVSVPAPTAVVATAKLTRVNKGPYGLHPVIDVPVIAGGAGSVIRASIKMGRLYTYEGQRRSVFSGRCPDGRIQARGTFKYRDGTLLAGTVLRGCTVAD
jgi:uncharacterized low-complexity protein